MKQSEIRPCALCGKGVMHGGQISFYRITLQRLVINLPAVRRQAGLEQMLGGAARLAAVMGPDEDMAKPISEPEVALICDACAMEPHLLCSIDERMSQQREDRGGMANGDDGVPPGNPLQANSPESDHG